MNVLRKTPILIALLLAVSPIIAQERGGFRHHDRGGKHEEFATKLGLTAEQRTQLEQLKQADSEGMKAARMALRDKRKALEDAMMSEPVDRAAVDARRADLSRAHDDMMRLSTESRLKAMQVFTPQQREQLRQMREDRKQRFEERRQKRGDRQREPRPTP